MRQKKRVYTFGQSKVNFGTNILSLLGSEVAIVPTYVLVMLTSGNKPEDSKITVWGNAKQDSLIP